MQAASTNAQSKHTLPAHATTFIGREADIAEITVLLAQPECRLVTLLGPGGIGKTRLGIESARQMLDEYPDGVYFVPLAPLQFGDGMVASVAQALDLRFHGKGDQTDQFLLFLKDKRLLLLLDNFEHLLASPESTALLVEILNAAPYIKMIVTSREALNLSAEWIYQVKGMRFPEDATPLPDLPSYGSVRLFAERARQVRPDISGEEIRCAARICRLVEGMPLAIELAATWTRTLSCADIADEIQRNKDFLTTSQPDMLPRHRSIRAVFRQSWTMLTPEEQTVYQKLAVFRGGFTQQAAQNVAGASLMTLAALVNKSLVRQAETGRYDIHELLRQYAEEQLVEHGDIEATRDAHSAYYLGLLANYEADIQGHRQVQALNAIAADFDNMRTAWYWAAKRRNFETVNRALDALSSFCGIRVFYDDGMAMFRYARKKLAPLPGEAPHLVWAKTLLYWAEPDADRAQVEQALEIARRENATIEIAECYTRFGWIAFGERDYKASLNWLQQSLDLVKSTGNQFRLVRVMIGLGTVYVHLGQHDRQIDLVRQALVLARQNGDQEASADAMTEIAEYEFAQGHYAESERINTEAVALSREIGHRSMVAWATTMRGFCLLFLGKTDQSVQVVHEASAITEHLGFPIPRGLVMTVSAWTACAQGEYAQGKALAESALALLPDYRLVLRAITRLADAFAAVGLEDWDSAAQHGEQGLRESVEIHLTGPMVLGLAVMIPALAQDAAWDSLRMVELLGLVFNHPAAPPGFFNDITLLTTLRNTLRKALGTAYDAAWRRGATLDLTETVAAVLHHLRESLYQDAQGTIQVANQALIDPLTERELEILKYIVDGLTNREIAERSYVGVSTVKSHINHIYRKLDVRTRPQAMKRAGELGLIG